MNNKQEKSVKRPIKIKEKHKKLLVYAAFLVVFIGVMYLLFAPDVNKDTQQQEHKGMNVSIPQAAYKGLLDDKQSAYQQQQLIEAQERKRQAMLSLSDLFQKDTDTLSKPVKISKNQYTSSPSDNPIKASVSAYKDIHQTLDNFYTKEDPKTKALEEKIEALKKELADKDDAVSQEERQLALLEKSYQMAAKYIPAARKGEQKPPVKVTPIPSVQNKKVQVKEVQQYRESVVSSLQGSNLRKEQLFNTAVGITGETQRNTIKACVHQTMEITRGESVPIRLLEPIQVANRVILAQTVLMATPKLQGNRLLLTISSVQYRGLLAPIALTVYDLDGQKGLFVPGTLEQHAVKEVLTSLGNTSSNAISFNNGSASQQLLTDMGKGVLQGTSNYLKKKIGHIKIKVKAGHSVLLLSKEN